MENSGGEWEVAALHHTDPVCFYLPEWRHLVFMNSFILPAYSDPLHIFATIRRGSNYRQSTQKHMERNLKCNQAFQCHFDLKAHCRLCRSSESAGSERTFSSGRCDPAAVLLEL